MRLCHAFSIVTGKDCCASWLLITVYPVGTSRGDGAKSSTGVGCEAVEGITSTDTPDTTTPETRLHVVASSAVTTICIPSDSSKNGGRLTFIGAAISAS